MKKIIAVTLAVIMLMSFALTAFAEYENTHSNTGDHKKDITAIALTQVGYTESKQSPKYGNISGSYEAAFISWCAYEAEISDEIIIKTNSLNEMFAFFAYENRVESDPDYKPVQGDIVFMGTTDNVISAAVVTTSDEEYVTAVLCDSDGTVKKKQYSLTMQKIIGYAKPDYTYTHDSSTGNHITIASFLNFREQPTTNSNVITQIPLGTVLDVTTISGGWGKVTYKGNTGWVSMNYVISYTDTHTENSEYGIFRNVIDVSNWQGNIDWSKIASADIYGVILRIGLRATKTRALHIDDSFFTYYNAAKAAGLHVGCYFYSAAVSVADAREEAVFVIDTIIKNNLDFDLPVYLDLEESMTLKTGKETVCDITNTYLDLMEQANIYSGIYCSKSWAESCYTPEMFDTVPLWIAQYNDECTYNGNYGIWQYFAKGSISGVSAEYTDLNLCYIDYPQIIKDKNYNTNITMPHIEVVGDVNADGKLSAADARLALRISANLEEPTEEMITAADVNHDGKVTASDARMLLRASAGLEKL